MTLSTSISRATRIPHDDSMATRRPGQEMPGRRAEPGLDGPVFMNEFKLLYRIYCVIDQARYGMDEFNCINNRGLMRIGNSGVLKGRGE